jgi:hypothetical protein
LSTVTIFFTSSPVPFCAPGSGCRQRSNQAKPRSGVTRGWIRIERWALTHFQLPPTKNFLGAMAGRARAVGEGEGGAAATETVEFGWCLRVRDESNRIEMGRLYRGGEQVAVAGLLAAKERKPCAAFSCWVLRAPTVEQPRSHLVWSARSRFSVRTACPGTKNRPGGRRLLLQISTVAHKNHRVRNTRIIMCLKRVKLPIINFTPRKKKCDGNAGQNSLLRIINNCNRTLITYYL